MGPGEELWERQNTKSLKRVNKHTASDHKSMSSPSKFQEDLMNYSKMVNVSNNKLKHMRENWKRKWKFLVLKSILPLTNLFMIDLIKILIKHAKILALLGKDHLKVKSIKQISDVLLCLKFSLDLDSLANKLGNLNNYSLQKFGKWLEAIMKVKVLFH
jgi:hypothetical protein